jgi:benzoyl-CoA-dihydrodiol lyase
VPLLGVLPGTGGLTRLVDKRGVRRDLADLFATLEEGVRGERALEWKLVDAIAPPSRFDALVEGEASEIVARAGPPPAASGVRLEPLAPRLSEREIAYHSVAVELAPERRTASLRIDAPAQSSGDAALLSALRLARELDDAVLRLRFHFPELGLWLLRTRGSLAQAHALDRALGGEGWLAREVRALFSRVLKRLENSARSVFALVEPGSCFAGTLFELALAADRVYMLRTGTPEPAIELGAPNRGAHRMANGLSRLETRFAGDPAGLSRALAAEGPQDAERALSLGLVTEAPDALDWDEAVRLACEERASFSPDALTGLEQSLRFAGPETLETKIFARLSAWQNWIFQRPNASGADGALAAYGRPERPRFDWKRT